MFFNGLKIPTSVLCRLTLGTIVPSLVPIGNAVSDEKTFGRKILKESNNSNIVSWIKIKIRLQIDTFTHVRILEIYAINSVSPLCSIFSNSGHVFLTDQKSQHRFYAKYPKEHSCKVWFQFVM